jgi:hypothetical protein
MVQIRVLYKMVWKQRIIGAEYRTRGLEKKLKREGDE